MPSAAVNTEPTVAAIRRLPPHERLPWVERIRICYPQWQQITTAIQTCHQIQPIAAEPPCLLLIGQTGVGKTTLLTSYARTYPPRQTTEGLQQPIVQATIVPPATVKSMAATLLAALGDPAADKGTTNSMTRRVIHFFRHCQVQMLILDELQHFVDRESQKVLWTVSNWLKTLIKESGVACVLAGLANEAEQVVDANPQLARLFGDPIVLQPFAWDATQLLATAFDQRLGGERRHIANPFRGDLPAVPALSRPIASGAAVGTNRRSRSRTPRAPTLNDLR
jgi:hypothetical protein